MLKKLCFIGGGMKGGGQERSLTQMANYFAQKGYEVSIINLFKTEQFYKLDDEIKVYWPNIDRKKYHRLIYALLLIPFLRRIIRSISPDVILSYGEWYNPFVILFTRHLGYPVWVFDRMGPEVNLGTIVGYGRRILYKYATGVIVQTKMAAEILSKKINQKNIFIIPNPVNCINSDTRIKKKQIVSLGRLSKEKGHKILIRAFAKIKHEEWTLHFIGNGPELLFLKKESERCGISDRVIFHGHLKNFDQILGESEIFVLPSFYEGFPNALLEAMSVPLACISSNCVAGPSDIIQNGINGLLVETSNEAQFAEAMYKLIINVNLRKKLAKEAYKVREHFAFDKIANTYIDFISKTIK
jgi:GalNAc-alpha-(1->4)-GalNAc-alpha-(1->3)-diNAcBac-PP-undecaprenol alpha-1,4-N-acetyl-D-galactosaminyltransferase